MTAPFYVLNVLGLCMSRVRVFISKYELMVIIFYEICYYMSKVSKLEIIIYMMYFIMFGYTRKG